MEKNTETPIINTASSDATPEQMATDSPASEEISDHSEADIRKRNLFFTSVGLMVMVGILVAYWLYQNMWSHSVTPTAVEPEMSPSSVPAEKNEWKTYQNKTSNFAIDHPSNWKVREFPDTGNGAAFQPADLPQDYQYEYISVSKYGRVLMADLPNPSFEEYVKYAGSEIQNYNSLATIQKVVTRSGITGYTATWNVAAMGTGEAGVSLPRTYFEFPGNEMATIQVVLDNEEYLDVYQQMLASFRYLNPSPSSSELSTSPSQPLADEKMMLASTIKQAIATKHQSDTRSLTVKVSSVEGNYSKGSVSDEMSGGMWFAAKVNGTWQLVSDGNGVTLCADVDPYPDFPNSMIPECWDESSQTLIQR